MKPSASVSDPIALGPTQLRNRVFVAPHTTNFGAAGANVLTQRHLDYHRERARGGAALIITEGIRVHPTSLRRLGVHAYSDEALPGLAALADVVHGEDTKLFAQLLHTGRHSGDDHYGAWGAGPTPWSSGANVPHTMNRFDIRTVIDGFAAAADRIVRAGWDGMEVHFGHGHLLHQFLSPVTNHRTDAYGGSARARARLALECYAAVVEAVAGRATVGIRLSAHEFLPGGFTPDDMVEVISWVREQYPIDFLHVSHSAYIGAATLSTQMADMSYPSKPFRDLPARFSTEFPETPILAICRLDTIESGAELLKAGEADMIGFARAHIADPYLLSHARGEAVDQARRTCIACNQGCNANLEAITPITCTVNPVVGMERAWSAAEGTVAQPQRVLVIGAGPAGIEAAITAARRGHAVDLYDSRDEVGGGLPLISHTFQRDRFGVLLSELRENLAASSVRVVTGTTVTTQIITDGEYDAVVLATGAIADPGTRGDFGDLPVFESVDVIDNPSQVGAHCVIIDDVGGWEASSLAEHLASAGVRVDMVSPTAAYAGRITVYSRLALGERLAEENVTVHTLAKPKGTDGNTLVLGHTAGAGEFRIERVDSVVHVRPARAQAGLLDQLADEGWIGQLYLIGDAYAPRSVQEAIYEGRATGLALGVAGGDVQAALRLRPPYLLGALREQKVS